MLECGVGVWCLEFGVGVWCWSVVLEVALGQYTSLGRKVSYT